MPDAIRTGKEKPVIVSEPIEDPVPAEQEQEEVPEPEPLIATP